MRKATMRKVTKKEHRALKKGTCPFCGGRNWFEGPCGGGSTNIYCANGDCDAGFNLPGPFTPLVIREPLQKEQRA